VRAAIDRWRGGWKSEGDTRAFALREARSGALAGGCELRLREDERADLSYWVFPAYRGRGLALRAVRIACEWAFVDLAVQTIELYIEPDNAPSRAVAHRAGFSEE
jgi:RimJ/RimL family protein N-acetyltransferase